VGPVAVFEEFQKKKKEKKKKKKKKHFKYALGSSEGT